MPERMVVANQQDVSRARRRLQCFSVKNRFVGAKRPRVILQVFTAPGRILGADFALNTRQRRPTVRHASPRP